MQQNRSIRPTGLPSGPGRSRSKAPSAGREEARYDQRAPPIPRGAPTQQQPRRAPHQRQTSADSSSTDTSAQSSLLQRMSGGSSGYSSSRTSFESERGVHKPRGRRDARSVDAEESEIQDDKPAAEGYSIWNTVASVASGLTVNVGMAWASNITTYAGEETPEGQESRLTRAMKAYHISKARDPTDLPDWLFEAHERHPAACARSARPDDRREGSPRESPARSRGLRDIYDAAAAPAVRQASRAAARGYDDETGPSKATNRLKALRDAKRTANTVNATRVHDHDPIQVTPSRGGPSNDVQYPEQERQTTPPPTRRVGLPSGPGRPRRF